MGQFYCCSASLKEKNLYRMQIRNDNSLFLNDMGLLKLLYLATENIAEDLTQPVVYNTTVKYVI
jgi:hypothetical protein